MSMTLDELEAILEEASPLITGRTVLAFRDLGVDSFMMILESQEDPCPIMRLLLSVRPGLDRAHLTPRRSPQKGKVAKTEFASRLEAALKGARLIGAGLLGSDRILKLTFETPSALERTVVAELIGRHANLLLLDDSGEILEAVRSFEGKHRLLKRGAAYEPPAAPIQKRTPQTLPRFEVESPSLWTVAPLNGAADAFFLELERNWEQNRLKEKLEAFLKRRLAKIRKRRTGLEKELDDAGQADRLRRSGDILQANFHRLKKGMKSFDGIDLFTGKEEKIVIPLDPAKDPADNIARYYRRAKKLEQSIDHLFRRIREAGDEIERLEARLGDVLKLEDLQALEAMAETLGLDAPTRRTGRKPAEQRVGPGFRRFRSSDGLLLLVGKDGATNDRLTFRTARGNDIWLHCHEAAGSHVVIQKDGRKPVPLNSLMDAGILAMHFSKKRDADRSEVIYTQCKYVKRIRGSAPGRVQVERFKTLLIRPAPERLKRILDTAEPS